MAVPDEIANNSSLVSSKIRAWTDWFKAGKGIKQGTMNELIALSVADPTEPFICIDNGGPTPIALMYMGDVTVGTNGFIVLGGGTW